VSFSFSLNGVMIQTEVTPDSIFYACFKIGGLIGLTRIFILFNFIHEYKFEQDLKNFHKESTIDEAEPIIRIQSNSERDPKENLENQDTSVDK
jgi:hypothetical protein